MTIGSPTAIEKTKKKGRKKKKEDSVLNPVEEITLEVSDLTYVRLSPDLAKSDKEEEEVLENA